MSTRTRIVLYHPTGVTTTGSRAVKELLILTHRNISIVALAKVLSKVEGASKTDKLLKVAEKLPHGYTLTFFQEPRNTRKNRSLYWQQTVGAKQNKVQVGGLG